MNRIYPGQTLGKEFSRCTGGVLGIGLYGSIGVWEASSVKTRQGASRQEREVSFLPAGSHGLGKYPMILLAWIRASFRVESCTSA